MHSTGGCVRDTGGASRNLDSPHRPVAAAARGWIVPSERCRSDARKSPATRGFSFSAECTLRPWTGGNARPALRGDPTETIRACFLAPEFLPARGGVGIYSVALVRELARLADVTVLTLTRREGSLRYGEKEMEAAVEHRARVIPIAEARDTFVYNARFQIALLRHLPSFARAERFDLIHSQHAHMPDVLAGPLLRGIPFVRTVHSTIAGQRETIRFLESLGQAADITERWQVAIEPILRAAEWSTLNHPGLLFPVCRFMGDQLVGLGVRPDRIRVIHNGVDTELFRPDTSPGSALSSDAVPPKVLFVGRFTLAKGIGTLLQAMPRIVRAVPDVTFEFTGGMPVELSDAFSLPPEIRSRLRFLGYIPHEEIPALFRAATVIVAPSLRDSFPFAVLESMATGAALVASRVGGIPEAIRSGVEGVLVDPGNSDQLADALIELLQNSDRRAGLGTAARRRAVTQFTWGATARATLEGYREAIATRGLSQPAISNGPSGV